MDDVWEALETLGYSTGHLVAECPACHQRQMVPWFTASSVKPHCAVCLGSGWDRRSGTFKTPELIVISDRSKVTNKTPGQVRNATQLKKAGCIIRGSE